MLVGIGLLGLMLMIRRSQPQAASAAPAAGDQTKIEAAITRLTGVRSEMADRMDEIVKKFYEFSDVVQVKVDELVNYLERAPEVDTALPTVEHFVPVVVAMGAAEDAKGPVTFPITGFMGGTFARRSVQFGS